MILDDFWPQPFPSLQPYRSNKMAALTSVARGRGFANLLITQLCWRLTRSALLCYSDGYCL